MGGIGKTTLADAVYKEVSTTFEGCHFLQNVRGKIEKQGRESVRNEFLSILLKDKEIRIDTPSIGYPYRERLNNLRVIVVLDDVYDPEQVDWMGVKHFGDGSKIILTSRDRQVLKNGGATQIHKVEELNEKYSLQLFSITAFKQLNPSVDFLHLSYEFVRLAHGSPLALKILGAKLYSKCLFDINSYGRISMHDMLEEMGKDIVDQESEYPEKRKRLWNPKHVYQVLNNNKGTDRIEGIKFDMSRIDNLLSPTCFENMSNLRYVKSDVYWRWTEKQPTNGVDIVYLPNELSMEQLWNEDFQDLVNLREIDVSFCDKLRKIPNLLGAINLESLNCEFCLSLVKLTELPKMLNHLNLPFTQIEEVPGSIEHLDGLETLDLRHCPIVKFPKNPRKLTMTDCKSLKLLSELPSNLKYLDTRGCISLEGVSFSDQNFHSFDGKRDYKMIFSNCFSLNQDSVDNIEANYMLQIQFLAEKWASRYDHELSIDPEPNLVYCFPGNKISADRFEYQSMNSSLSLKMATRGSSGRRLLVFAICLVVNLTDCDPIRKLKFICEYQPLAASGNDGDGGFKKFKSELFLGDIAWDCRGDHVFILCGKDMVKEDQNYEEASFQFYIKPLPLNEKKHIKVKKCGVHVIYVDAESCTITDVVRCDKSNLNFDSQGDANTMEPHHHSATETSTRRSKRHSMQKQQEGDQTGTGTQGIDHVVAGTSIHVVGPDDLCSIFLFWLNSRLALLISAFNGDIDFTTIAAVLVNGVHHEGDQIGVCGYGLQGSIVTNIRATWTPHPMKEIRVKVWFPLSYLFKLSVWMEVISEVIEFSCIDILCIALYGC
ncbi:hypothetical protein F3Y22_tig00112249pilonHSYRG00294 [Hibiscus syriacus]|uniref:NB-ARC domain-containing protein n=1 Tax=Hibiscus syriacus TaxID=106335 RepID=A0A6A2XR04_HIBSY|nr:hypothetical protein F3Y22_tig00112249pilonHSYRG00294 [Hibiscus syriacus]